MKRNNFTPYLLILPATLFLVLLYAYPILTTFIQSLSKVNMLTGESEFLGLANYRQAFSDSSFYDSLSITLKYTFVTVLLKMFGGLLFAIFLSGKIKFKKPLRIISLVPWAIPQVAIGTLWIWVLNGQYGYLNYFLRQLNVITENINFLSDPKLAFYSVAFVDAWVGIPFICLSLISALEGIPQSLYEACELDGGNAFSKFRDITIPNLAPVFLSLTLLVIIWTFNSFNIIYVLTQGGPMRATETLMVKIYREAFSNFDMAYSATLTSIAVIILLCLTSIYLWKGNSNDEE